MKKLIRKSRNKSKRTVRRRIKIGHIGRLMIEGMAAGRDPLERVPHTSRTLRCEGFVTIELCRDHRHAPTLVTILAGQSNVCTAIVTRPTCTSSQGKTGVS